MPIDEKGQCGATLRFASEIASSRISERGRLLLAERPHSVPIVTKRTPLGRRVQCLRVGQTASIEERLAYSLAQAGWTWASAWRDSGIFSPSNAMNTARQACVPMPVENWFGKPMFVRSIHRLFCGYWACRRASLLYSTALRRDTTGRRLRSRAQAGDAPVLEMVRFAEQMRHSACLIEQAPSALGSWLTGDRRVVGELHRRFEALGYDLHVDLLDAGRGRRLADARSRSIGCRAVRVRI